MFAPPRPNRMLHWMAGALAAVLLSGCTTEADPIVEAVPPPHLKTVVLADATATFSAPALPIQIPTDAQAHPVIEFEVPSGLQDFQLDFSRMADGASVGGGCRLMRDDGLVVQAVFGNGEAASMLDAQTCRLLVWNLQPGTYRAEYLFGEATAAQSHTIHVVATAELPPWLPALRP